MKIYDLCDKKILNRNIDGIDHNGVHLGIKITLSEDTRLIDGAFETFLNLESWDNNKEIEAEIEEVDGKKRIITDANIVRGSHPSLMYRGNALKRHKIWFQEDETNFKVYKYTGWQHGVVPATFVVRKDKHKALWDMKEYMKTVCSQCHWIATMYENGNDYIGMHSDKTHTWKRNSSFHVVKWGSPRLFRIEDLEGHVIFEKILPSGTEIIVDSRSNELTRHGVPVMEGNVGISGSIVGRDIACSISIDQMERNIVEAKKSKVKREEAKEKRKREEKRKRKRERKEKRKRKRERREERKRKRERREEKRKLKIV